MTRKFTLFSVSIITFAKQLPKKADVLFGFTAHWVCLLLTTETQVMKNITFADQMPGSDGQQPRPVDTSAHRYPYCVVWTPIPLITWLVPLIGHMGICLANGVVRDFAGPYYVSQDEMAFGWPTKYWQLDPRLVTIGQSWDDSVKQASDEYMHRMHHLCCDNCHSHVSMALNLMRYNGKSNYNMVSTFFLFTIHSKYISFWSFLKTWIPFIVLISVIIGLVIYFK